MRGEEFLLQYEITTLDVMMNLIGFLYHRFNRDSNRTIVSYRHTKHKLILLIEHDFALFYY